jgi:hypothetical protein
MTVTLLFEGHAKGAVEPVRAEIANLVVAGWTGRDSTALEHHIEELQAIGVPRPSAVPLFYRMSVDRLMQAERIQVVGPDTSGEVEPMLIGTADRLWVTVASDHTDRKAEVYSVALSKQLCPKICGRTAWRYEEVEAHWDRLVLRAWISEGGRRVLYQEGTVGIIRDPRDLIIGYTGGSKHLPAGTAMSCGTFNAIGGIRPSSRFEMELEDPVLGRRITHTYDIEIVPLVS